MAALLVGGVILGIDKIQQRREAKRARAAEKAHQDAREKYFQSSKATEAAAEARRQRRRERRERRGLDGDAHEGSGSSEGEGSDSDEEVGAPPPYVAGESSHTGERRVGESAGAVGEVRGDVPRYGEHILDERVEPNTAAAGVASGSGAGSTAGPSGIRGAQQSSSAPPANAAAAVSEEEMARRKKKFWKSGQVMTLVGTGFAR